MSSSSVPLAVTQFISALHPDATDYIPQVSCASDVTRLPDILECLETEPENLFNNGVDGDALILR